MRLHASVYWPAYAPVLGDRIMFPLAVWRDGQQPVINEKTRTTPVFFRFPRLESESIVVHLPDGCQPAFVPKPITARSGAFAYALAVTSDPEHGLLRVERTSVNRAIEIPVASYAKARDWFRRVAVADQISIPLTRAVDPSRK